ncbi:transcription factor HES-5-like [Nematolebias whitei]|uniref:transcription factor HES-5-like n=1 Tax=Nematolebias whitei TaxID=451745 RepID=UPI00189820F3|nr:transcription factor HES-5-like [Nematolebias whitei]
MEIDQNVTASIISQEHLNHKLRKPLVEKLRRGRINSSIEQLKSLLELLKQQPDSKLEKADILETTVCFLTRLQLQQDPAVDSAAADQVYSRCVQEVVHFLSKDQEKTRSHRRLLDHFNKLQSEKNLREADFCPLSSTVQTRVQSAAPPGGPGRHCRTGGKLTDHIDQRFLDVIVICLINLFL